MFAHGSKAPIFLETQSRIVVCFLGSLGHKSKYDKILATQDILLQECLPAAIRSHETRASKIRQMVL